MEMSTDEKQCAVESVSYLVGDVGSCIADVAVHLAHDSNVLVAVQQRVLLLARATSSAMRCLVRLEARIGEHDDQALGVLVRGRNGVSLLGNELRQRWRRQGLCP